MTPVADGVAADDELHARIVAHLIEAAHRHDARLGDCGVERIHHHLRRLAGSCRPMDHVAHAHRIVEGPLIARRQCRLARLEDVGDPLLVGPHRQVADAEVEHDQVTALNDTIAAGGLDAIRPGDVDARHAERAAQVALVLLLLDPPRHVGQCRHTRRDHLVREGAFGDLSAHLARFAEGDQLRCRAS